MTVCITEKPSVARDIAKILGANGRRDGYFEGNDYCVTWTYGHLCTLKDPADYDRRWQRWTLSMLPMIPERFGIKLIEQESYKKQFEVIRGLVEKADQVVNCGDAGQEGELIQRWVLQKAGNKKPVKRLWISSLTDDAIKEGFKNLRPAADFDNLYFAGLSRAIGDWLLGLNSTRLYSLRYGSGRDILSVGRVQTPTLAMIVERQNEIENFKKEDFWEIRVNYHDVWFNASPAKRYASSQKVDEAVAALRDKEFVVGSVESKEGKEWAPRLFDLTSLQVECNAKWGWSADETLKLIQSLYEKKLTTYPRVDTTYLSEDLYAGIPDLLNKMTPYQQYVDHILQHKLSKTKRIFDNSKVTDHHAIIPTGESPKGLADSRERQLYNLIALRFLANFYPECKFSTTTVTGTVEGKDFKASGKVIVAKGWKELYPADDQGSKDGEAVLPQFTVGEHGPCRVEAQKKTTTPPKYFTEGTLLKAMETAGRNVDDDTLREALKANGIGRPSTRSAIIETLIKRGYVLRDKKKLVATTAGRHLVDTIADELLKSPKLTGIWENRLRAIEAGDYAPANFLAQLKEQLRAIIETVLNDTANTRILVEEAPAPKKRKKG